MKIVFFGTPDYVLPILKSLHKRYVTGPGKSPIVAVVTQSPKPVGRKQVLSYSAVDRWAHDHKIDIYYQASDMIKDGVVADLGILAAHGEIISKDVIKLFPQGILVIHPSLLPEFRGASPIQAAIASNLKTTGVSIIRMDERVDHGPIIAQFKEDIAPTDTSDILRARLFEKSAEVLLELMEPYIHNKIKPKVQDEANATYTTKILKNHGFVPEEAFKGVNSQTSKITSWPAGFILDNSFEVNANSLNAFIRAMYPWPCAWTKMDDKRIKIIRSHIEEGKLVIDEAQLEGKNPVTWKQLTSAYPSFRLS